MRKDVFEVIDSMIDKGEKINYSKIARQYDCDYRTVKKYYKERNGDYKKRRTPRKI